MKLHVDMYNSEAKVYGSIWAPVSNRPAPVANHCVLSMALSHIVGVSHPISSALIYFIVTKFRSNL